MTSYTLENNAIGIATSTSPSGPFQDALGVPLVKNADKNTPCITIDSGVFRLIDPWAIF
jgi:hypothetical protein